MFGLITLHLTTLIEIYKKNYTVYYTKNLFCYKKGMTNKLNGKGNAIIMLSRGKKKVNKHKKETIMKRKLFTNICIYKKYNLIELYYKIHWRDMDIKLVERKINKVKMGFIVLICI